MTISSFMLVPTLHNQLSTHNLMEILSGSWSCFLPSVEYTDSTTQQISPFFSSYRSTNLLSYPGTAHLLGHNLFWSGFKIVRRHIGSQVKQLNDKSNSLKDIAVIFQQTIWTKCSYSTAFNQTLQTIFRSWKKTSFCYIFPFRGIHQIRSSNYLTYLHAFMFPFSSLSFLVHYMIHYTTITR